MNNKKQPLVSIIIPVYNGSNYIEESIQSALAQTYPKIEVIVVNDGSNDQNATKNIVEKYKDKVRYFEKENGGVATALNLAIEKMKGEYFSWLSHDDTFYPWKIEKQIEFLENCDKYSILYADYDLIDANGKKIAECKKDTEMLKEKPEYGLLRGSINGITMLIPKKAFKDCGTFNSSLRCTQDYDMWFRMQEKYHFVHQPITTSSTRIHSMQDTQISPNAVKEGNNLWIRMIEETNLETKIRLEKSEYHFLEEMYEFLKTTPYEKALEYTEQELEKRKRKVKEIMSKYKISVIIPFYNRINLTIRAIDSVLKQDFKNYEILLINDGSTESLTKIKQKIKSNPKIKLINQSKNKGVSVSRNKGILESTGDYIAFLDSDDEFMENKLSTQLESMLLNDKYFSYTDYIAKENNTEQLHKCFHKDDEEYIYNCKIATPTIMMNRNFIVENNLKYRDNLTVCEDACFYLDILKRTDLWHVDGAFSIVNIEKSSCVNNIPRRLEGIKNILRYVLCDEYYQMKEKAIANLCEGYLVFSNTSLSNQYIEELENAFKHTSEEIVNPKTNDTLFYKVARKSYQFMGKVKRKILHQDRVNYLENRINHLENSLYHTMKNMDILMMEKEIRNEEDKSSRSE